MKKNNCWVWDRLKDKDGYGRVYVNRVTEIRAHRLSYVLFKGSIKKGLLVCHSCDNPSCINPDHLFLGTALDNNRDAIKKGRAVKVKGENHGRRKLTALNVQDIRQISHLYSRKYLAKKYGVDRKTIDNIINNKNWI